MKSICNTIEMIKVDLLYPSWLKAPNGASSFVNSLKTKVGDFRHHGIELNVYSNDIIEPRSFGDKTAIQKRNHFRNLIFKFAASNAVLSIFLFHYLSFHSRRLVSYYMKMKRKPDILFFQEAVTCYYFIKYCPKCEAKIILIKHDNGEDFKMLYYTYPKLDSWLGNLYLSRILRYVYPKVSKFLFVSQTSMNTFLEYHSNISPAKCGYVYNGIEPDFLGEFSSHTDTDTIKMVCVGTISDRKNQKMILQALLSLPKELQRKYSVIFVGDGEGKEGLIEISKNIESDVQIVGSSNMVNKYLSEADLFILTSKDEGLPISIIEAMRASLPIIATKIAGIPEMIIDRKSGFLINVSLDELVDVLISLHSYDLTEMGHRSRELFLDKFTLDGMIKNYKEQFRSLI